MENFNLVIGKYNFHDSVINRIVFDPCEEGSLLRRLSLEIDYYNWEGNNENNSEWHWKKMFFEIEHCFLLRYEFPNIIENGNEISDVELCDSDIEIIKEYYNKNKSNIYSNLLKDKKFENCFSIKIFTHSCYGDQIFGETTGFLQLAGFNGKIELFDSDICGAVHIPVKK